MADLLDDDLVNPDNSGRTSRPSLTQVKALIDFIQKHPTLVDGKIIRNNMSRQKVKKLWIEFSNIANSMEGTIKSTGGWVKYWADKRRNVMMKQKQIEEGKLQDSLSATEQKIYDLSQKVPQNNLGAKRKRVVKGEPSPDEDVYSADGLFPETEEVDMDHVENAIMTTEADEKQLDLMEKCADIMDRQAQALSQMAQATYDNSKALERLAEASHIQALAVDRLAATFDNINSSVHDVRNSIVSIDYTLKRCYPTTPTQQRTTNNLFS